MNGLNKLLNFIFVLFLIIVLIISQLYLLILVVIFLQKLIVYDSNYLLLVSNSYRYLTILVLFSTFVLVLYLNKKRVIKLNNDLDYITKCFLNKKSFIILSIIFVMFVILSVFNYNVIYENKIIVNSLFKPNQIYSYKKAKNVNVSITKNSNNYMEINYILYFDDFQINIMDNIIDQKDQKSIFESYILIDQNIKEFNIPKNIDDTYLNEYIKKVSENSKQIKILFDQIN